jgi:two-component system cell cycle sensor histidine kinase/response regulator CckA
MQTDLLALDAALEQTAREIFGTDADSMERVEARARERLPHADFIVWEGDAATFQFSYVGRDAERILGHPVARWLEPGFWAERVVHPEDRDGAVAFCAVATGQGRDHDFRYRALGADGGTVWLHDLVTVLRGPRGIPQRLRGIMIRTDAPDPEG